jgi:hypothetical protein
VKKGRVTTLRENIFNGAEKSKGQNQATMARYRDVFVNRISFDQNDEDGDRIDAVTWDKDHSYFVPVTDDGYADLFKLMAVVYNTYKDSASKVF